MVAEISSLKTALETATLDADNAISKLAKTEAFSNVTIDQMKAALDMARLSASDANTRLECLERSHDTEINELKASHVDATDFVSKSHAAAMDKLHETHTIALTEMTDLRLKVRKMEEVIASSKCPGMDAEAAKGNSHEAIDTAHYAMLKSMIMRHRVQHAVAEGRICDSQDGTLAQTINSLMADHSHVAIRLFDTQQELRQVQDAYKVLRNHLTSVMAARTSELDNVKHLLLETDSCSCTEHELLKQLFDRQQHHC